MKNENVITVRRLN